MQTPKVKNDLNDNELANYVQSSTLKRLPTRADREIEVLLPTLTKLDVDTEDPS